MDGVNSFRGNIPYRSSHTKVGFLPPLSLSFSLTLDCAAGNLSTVVGTRERKSTHGFSFCTTACYSRKRKRSCSLRTVTVLQIGNRRSFFYYYFLLRDRESLDRGESNARACVFYVSIFERWPFLKKKLNRKSVLLSQLRRLTDELPFGNGRRRPWRRKERRSRPPQRRKI
jgi:hypothetical protein